MCIMLPMYIVYDNLPFEGKHWEHGVWQVNFFHIKIIVYM